MVSLKIIILFTCLVCIDADNILVLNPFTSKSHYIAIRPIGIELAQRGHNVTILTAYKEPNPPKNYHEIMVDNKAIWEVLGGEKPNIFHMVNKTIEEFLMEVLWTGGYGFTEVVLKSQPVKEFLKKENKFDIVISEQFHFEALNILAYKYKAPLVLVATIGNCMKHNFVTGNPLQLNTAVFEYLSLKDSTSLWGRLRNTYVVFYEYIWWRYWFLNKQEALVTKYLTDLQEPVPSLYEVQKNASLLLINSHFSFDPPIALLPNIIEVGGMHVSPNTDKLPKDLQHVIDNAKYGVIYMSLGSNVVISEMDEDKKEAFFNVFRKLKETVLLKWEKDTIHNKPDNVIVRKWFPQKEIFAHPNIKLFISHGGLIGTQEALYNGIPILGIPIFSDQYNNLDLTVKLGCGKILEYYDINENAVESALKDMLDNESFKIKAEEVSFRFRDRPMSPLDTAVWWIEYVLRHKGAEFMKNPARNLSLFQYLMVDIYLAVIGTIVAVILLLAIVVKVLKHFFGFSAVSNEKKKRS